MLDDLAHPSSGDDTVEGTAPGAESCLEPVQTRFAGPDEDARVAEAYQTLRSVARAQLRRHPANSLAATDLVHEALARLLRGQRGIEELDADHLVAVAATAMRSVLVDRARRRLALKRGGGAAGLDLEGLDVDDRERSAEVIGVHDALEVLAQQDPRAARVVELRFFGGLNEAETAAVIGVNERTVRRDWRYARAWLNREVGDGEA